MNEIEIKFDLELESEVNELLDAIENGTERPGKIYSRDEFKNLLSGFKPVKHL